MDGALAAEVDANAGGDVMVGCRTGTLSGCSASTGGDGVGSGVGKTSTETNDVDDGITTLGNSFSLLVTSSVAMGKSVVESTSDPIPSICCLAWTSTFGVGVADTLNTGVEEVVVVKSCS